MYYVKKLDNNKCINCMMGHHKTACTMDHSNNVFYSYLKPGNVLWLFMDSILLSRLVVYHNFITKIGLV